MNGSNHRAAASPAADGLLNATEGHPDAPAPAHTPGPWSLSRWGLTGYEIQGGGRQIAVVNKAGETERERLAKRRREPGDDWPPVTLVTQEEAAADARLMVAAPDLLAACEEAAAFLENMLRGRSQDSALYRRMRAAIAKAKGEQS